MITTKNQKNGFYTIDEKRYELVVEKHYRINLYKSHDYW